MATTQLFSAFPRARGAQVGISGFRPGQSQITQIARHCFLACCWQFALLLGSLLLAGCASSEKLALGPQPAGIVCPPPVPAPAPLTTLPSELPEPPERRDIFSDSATPRPDTTTDSNGEFALPDPATLLPPLIQVEELPPTTIDASDDFSSALALPVIIASVDRTFPLLLSAEQERAAAAGRRVAAEGVFDLNLSSRGLYQAGTFPSERFDILAEQASPWHGMTMFGGYRFGYGDFPVYYGDRLTADGGEVRAGVSMPLLRDAPIDTRRAKLRQSQLGEPLAAVDVQRLRIGFVRTAAHRYWNWVAAGEHYQINSRLLQIASRRQAGLEETFEQGQIAEFVVIDNRRLIAEREVFLIAAERRLQQAAFELSLYYRDENGNPVVPPSERLPDGFVEYDPAPIDVTRLRDDVEIALRERPELHRYRLLRQQVAVELQLADNQLLPAVNAVVASSQDMGLGKKSEGMFQLNRTVAEAGLVMEVPLQRRAAYGRVQEANAAMTQLVAESKFARDHIVFEVQDTVSNLDRTHLRLNRAREEQQIAQRVAELEIERFEKGQGTLLEVNLRELAAAGAQSKVVDALADYYRALADYWAALGLVDRIGR